MNFLSNLDRSQLHQQWWNRTNTTRLALIYTPAHFPYGGLDMEVSPGDIAQRKRSNAAVDFTIPKDTLVTGYVDYATALIPAMLGAGFQQDGHTTWAIPVSEPIQRIQVPPFDPAHPLFHSYIERVQAMLAGWSWETYLPANYAYLGPLDVLSGLVGPERLAIELYEHPREVKRLATNLAEYLCEMAAYELSLFRLAGVPQEGMPCAFSYWLPGSGFMFSEDFCALVSRKHYAEFFLEADTAFAHSVDSTLLHIHSAGFQCLPSILENPYVQALELANDIDNRDIHKLIKAGKMVQETGRPVQVSSWEHALEEWEIERILNELDSRGLTVALQADSYEDALRLYEKIKTWPE